MGLKFASNLEEFELVILERYWNSRKEFETTLRQGTEDAKKLHTISVIAKAMNDIYEESNDDYKTLIDMRYGDGEDFAEIADEMGMRVSRIRKFNRRLLDKLAIKIGWVSDSK